MKNEFYCVINNTMLNTIFLAIVKSSNSSSGEYEYVSIDAKSIKTVKDLRTAVAVACGFERDSFHMVFAGKLLDDENLSVIYDYRMQDETIVHIVLREKAARQ